MPINDILNSTPAEILDYMACLAIVNGAKEKNVYTFDEIMEMN